MARLSLLMAPAVSILWALALVQLVKPFVTILREKQIPRRKMRFKPRVGKEFSVGFILLMFLLLTVNFALPATDSDYSRVIERANSPTTIAASSLPLRAQISDWLDALNWMRVNLPSDAVVLSWWDYGYWITTIANKTTLADNGTVNSTQIGKIGEVFMSNETEAVKIIEEYDVTHVVIFITFGSDDSDYGYGDEGKWRWMARIRGWEDEMFGNYTLGNDSFDTNEDGRITNEELVPNENGTNTVLYKLMHYARDMVTSGASNIQLEYFERAYFSQEDLGVQWIPVGSNNFFAPMVCVYEVVY
jgi:asparagine N-glycosylation enzyme membrane subunit Stt3